MRTLRGLLFILFSSSLVSFTIAADDSRTMVELPKMMQSHMMSNMRGHLQTINSILILLSKEQYDEAADLAETTLGMSSLSSHGASHMAKLMPDAMRAAGTNMHRAASRFALKAQEADSKAAYKALSEITTACVACHSAYKIR